MKVSRLLFVVLSLLAFPALAGPPAAPPPVAPRAAPAEVTLVVKKPLRLVEYVFGGKRSGQVGLEGVLVVELFNPGATPSTLTTLDVHGLVFRDRKTGAEHRLIHPCDCALLAGAGDGAPDGPSPARSHAIAPGGHATLAIEDFGCSGGPWKAPPPGDYDVTYRVLRGTFAPPPPAGPDANPATLIDACRKMLESPGFWNDGPVSRPVRVKLGKPVRKRI